MEYLHDSRDKCTIPPCGHPLHHKCHAQMLKMGLYACPVCGEAMLEMEEHWRQIDDEIAHTPMPEEYRDFKVFVLCKDCHHTTQVNFHVLGLKCQSRGSYNTARADDPDGAQKNAATATEP